MKKNLFNARVVPWMLISVGFSPFLRAEGLTPTDTYQVIKVISEPTSGWFIASVVITALLAVAAGATLVVIYRQTKAIELQAAAMMEADCALLLIAWDDWIHINPEVENGVLSHCFQWNCQNVGKSPAFVQQVGSRFVAIKSLGDLPDEPEYPPGRILAHESEPILPGAMMIQKIYSPLETEVPYNDMENERMTGKSLLFAFGFARYLDVYGRPQETRFGVVYKNGPAQNPQVGRFQLAGPPAYNRYKNQKS
jgi:hypothetical protein